MKLYCKKVAKLIRLLTRIIQFFLFHTFTRYLKNFAENPKNLMILSCYQGPGSIGRKIQDGEKIIDFGDEHDNKKVEMKLRIEFLTGLSPHAGRNEILSFFNNMSPRPKRILVNHGEVSKSLDLASTLHKSTRRETSVPRGLESVRVR